MFSAEIHFGNGTTVMWVLIHDTGVYRQGRSNKGGVQKRSACSEGLRACGLAIGWHRAQQRPKESVRVSPRRAPRAARSAWGDLTACASIRARAAGLGSRRRSGCCGSQARGVPPPRRSGRSRRTARDARGAVSMEGGTALPPNLPKNSSIRVRPPAVKVGPRHSLKS
eukprot:gene8884-biopygen18167